MKKFTQKINESILSLSDKPKDFMTLDLDGKYRIRLNGTDKNAIALMGYAALFAIKKNYTYDQLKDVLEAMSSCSYEQILQVLDEHFGDMVNIYR